MPLKKSMFNIEIKPSKGEKVLLYNTFNMSFGAMDEKSKEIYDRIETYDEAETENEDNLKELTLMKSNGFVVDTDNQELQMLKVISDISKYDTKSLSLTIAPTLDCNMACPYCFEKNKNIGMSSETRRELIEFVERKIDQNSINNLSISWYGGEPLLELDTIIEISDQLIDLCNKNNIKYQASIVTNGSLLDKPTAILLRDKCSIARAQITIDGLYRQHSRRRILKNGQDSFSVIVKNIDDIKEILTVSIRVNLDRTNTAQAEELIDYILVEKNWGKHVFLYFAPVHNMSENCNIREKKCYTSKEFGEINSILLRKVHSMGYSSIVKAQEPKRTGIFCSATAVNSFVVDPEGYLYTCWNNVGVRPKSIGTLKSGELLNGEYIKWLSLELPQRCMKCSFLPVCHGGCPDMRLKNSNEPVCSHTNVSLLEHLRLDYEEFLEQKQQSSLCSVETRYR